MKRAWVCMVGALVVILATAYGPVPAAPVSRVFNVALFAEPDFIDPHVVTSVGFVPIENAYEGLVYTDRDTSNLKPVLAESWTISPNGRQYTFKIRRGVKFHDGAPLDAEAVKISFERLMKLNKGPAWALANVEAITVKDPYTVEVRIRPGGVPFLQGLVRAQIVSPKTIREQDKGGDLAQDYLNRVSAGTGPYRIVSWQRSQRVVLKKFDDYWGGWKTPNHFTDVNLLVVPEATTQIQMLEKGEIDIAFKFPVESLPVLQRNADLQVVTAPGLRVLYLLLNASASPTSDVRVRQAINYAFDHATYLKATENTYEAPVGPVPIGFLGGWKPNFPYKFDVARAAGLLREAGYSETNKAKLIADLLIANTDQQKAGEILQAGLKATGMVDIDLRPGDFNATRRYNMDWQRTRDPATAHHLFGLFTPPRIPDPYAYLWYIFHADAGAGFANNIMSYNSPRFDFLVNRATQTTSDRARTELYRQATQLLIDDAAALFIGTQRKIYIVRKNIGGFYPHPTWYPHVIVYDYFRR